MRDLIRIMIRTKKRIDDKAALINYYTLEKDMNNKKNRKYCKTLISLARRIIYTLYHKEDQIIRNNIIDYRLKSIGLINYEIKTRMRVIILQHM